MTPLSEIQDGASKMAKVALSESSEAAALAGTMWLVAHALCERLDRVIEILEADQEGGAA